MWINPLETSVAEHVWASGNRKPILTLESVRHTAKHSLQSLRIKHLFYGRVVLFDVQIVLLEHLAVGLEQAMLDRLALNSQT